MVAQSLGIGSIGMPVCSDIIESLYGVGKTHGTGEVKDANRIALRLPSYCGALSDDAAEMVMGISTKQQQKIETELFSLTRQRRKMLPNPGTITDFLGAEDKQYLSLLPMPKTGEKQGIISNITDGYMKIISCNNITIRFHTADLERIGSIPRNASKAIDFFPQLKLLDTHLSFPVL